MEIIVLAVLVEAVWESLKMITEAGKFSIDRAGAIILSCLFCICYQVDLFNIIEISDYITYLGMFGTGVIISRGANFVHDILEKVEG